MFNIILISIIALVHSNQAYTINEPRIVGGEDADINEFPHQISLLNNGSRWCGGFIYKSNIVVTAAHCLPYNTEKLTIAAGTTLLSDVKVLVRVKRAINHENFNWHTMENDIGLLVLETPLNFSSTIQPIRLASQRPQEGSEVTVTGWGDLKFLGPSTDHLQKANVKLISNSRCQELYPTVNITDTMLCTMIDGGGKGPCHGDSGGALINAATKEVLGVVSWGKGCAGDGQPGVYASVPKLHDWVVKTAEKNGGL